MVAVSNIAAVHIPVMVKVLDRARVNNGFGNPLAIGCARVLWIVLHLPSGLDAWRAGPQSVPSPIALSGIGVHTLSGLLFCGVSVHRAVYH